MTGVVEILPHVNASLNALATLLFIVGYVQIKRRQEIAHKWTMLACFGVSVVFLACYLTYHFNIPGHSKKFLHSSSIVLFSYRTILISHILLAAAVPFLAVITIWFGLTNRRVAHRKLAWWTFPIWLYVSITGVIVYLMLYQLYPPQS